MNTSPRLSTRKRRSLTGAWSIIGSPNLNFRSRQLDQENAFGILDRPLAAQLRRQFLLDVQKSKPINLREWRRRDPFQRLFEWIRADPGSAVVGLR